MAMPIQTAALLALSCFAACNVGRPKLPAVPPRSSPLERKQVDAPPPSLQPTFFLPLQVALITDGVAALQPGRDVRAELHEGFLESELTYVGFDQLSLAGSVDRVVGALHVAVSKPADPAAAKALRASVDLYLAVRRDVVVRRYIGRASCLPTINWR